MNISMSSNAKLPALVVLSVMESMFANSERSKYFGSLLLPNVKESLTFSTPQAVPTILMIIPSFKTGVSHPETSENDPPALIEDTNQ